MNYLAIVLSVLAVMIIGFLWYGPVLFGEKWMKLMGYSMRSMKQMQRTAWKGYLLNTVGIVAMVYVCSVLLHRLEISDWKSALELGALLWVGLIFPLLLGQTIREDKKIGLLVINAGYQFVSLLVIFLILVVL